MIIYTQRVTGNTQQEIPNRNPALDTSLVERGDLYTNAYWNGDGQFDPTFYFLRHALEYLINLYIFIVTLKHTCF